MQVLFAYKQGVAANYRIAEENIKEKFSPDLNSMEVQDHALLKVYQKRALELLKGKFKNDGISPVEENGVVADAVDQAIVSYHQLCDKDYRKCRAQLSEQVGKIYSFFIFYFSLIVEFHRVAEYSEKAVYNNFVNNVLIRGIALNKPLESAILANKLKWGNFAGEVKEWFRSIVAKDTVFVDYNNVSNPGFEEDQLVLNHLVKKIIFGNEVISSFMEDLDLHWAENKPIIKSLIVKTLGNIKEQAPEEFILQELSYNLEEDEAFFLRLFEEAVKLDESYKKMIADKAENWDVERLAITDRIILELAITEMISFPSIPVKVTINEYIEVSKKYSTPRSKMFINGMLDVIAETLTKSGDIRKSGRGLIDNK